MTKLVMNILTSGFPQKTNEIVLRRIKLINVLNFIPSVFSLVFFIYNLLNNQLLFSILDLLTVFILIGNMFLLRLHKKLHITVFITCFMIFLLSIYLLLIGGAEQAGYIWSLFFPIAATSLLELKKSIRFSIVFYIITLVSLLLPGNPLRFIEYSNGIKINFFFMLGLISIFAIYTKYSQDKAYKQLASHEHWLRSLIEHGASVYAIIDRDGKVLYESPSLMNVYGYEQDELIGKNIIEFVHPEDVPSALEEIKRLIINPGNVYKAEVRYRHKNGTWRDIEVNGINLLADPAVKGIVLTSHDITDRKRAENEIKALNETLEQRVIQRTEDLCLSEDKLRHSEKMRAIGQLAGGIAHDFNNQLAGILGCADFLRNQFSLGTELYECARTITNVAKNAGKLTAQLLDFARKGQYQSVPVNFHQLINEVIVLLERSIDKHIVIETHLSARSSVVKGDRDQFESMLLNIALNARDAIQKSGTISFSTDITEYANASSENENINSNFPLYLKIIIRDNGIGMDEETRKHIFEPFFTTKSKGQGVGMGLAAVYGTIKSQNGGIEVESSLGHGTTFSLYLPLAQDVVEKSDTNNGDTPVRKGNARVLFIDDNEYIVQMIGLVLKNLGYSITCFQESAKALHWYKNNYNIIDIIILDMVMPGLSARKVFEQFMEINPKAIIVLTSGYSINEDVETLLKQGAIDFLKKPFDIAELTGVISNSLGKNYSD